MTRGALSICMSGSRWHAWPYSQDVTGHLGRDVTGQDRTGQDRTGQGRIGRLVCHAEYYLHCSCMAAEAPLLYRPRHASCMSLSSNH